MADDSDLGLLTQPWQDVAPRLRQAFPGVDPQEMQDKWNQIRESVSGHQEQTNQTQQATQLLQTHAQSDHPQAWEDLAPGFQRRFPNVNQERLQQTYGQMQQAARLQRTRQLFQPGEGESVPGYLARRAIPFVSTGFNIGESLLYNAAKKRYEAGTASDDDLVTIANYEMNQEAAQRRDFGGRALSAIASIPAVAGEFATTGGIATGASAQAGRLLGTSLAGRVGARLAGAAAQTPFIPSLYADQAVQENIAKVREPGDPRGLATHLALGAMQNAVFSTIGNIGRAGAGLAERTVTNVAGGVIGQQAADTLGSALGLQTGYGLVGDIVRRVQGGQDDPLGNAAIQMLTFAAFAGLHEVRGRERITDAFTTASRELKRQGIAPGAAGARLWGVEQTLASAIERNPVLNRSEARNLYNDLPEGTLRDYGMALASGLPERTGPGQAALAGQGNQPSLSDLAGPVSRTEHLPPFGLEPGVEPAISAARAPQASNEAVPARPPEPPAAPRPRPEVQAPLETPKGFGEASAPPETTPPTAREQATSLEQQHLEALRAVNDARAKEKAETDWRKSGGKNPGAVEEARKTRIAAEKEVERLSRERDKAGIQAAAEEAEVSKERQAEAAKAVEQDERSGRDVRLDDAFDAANLNERQRHVLQERLQGRSHEEIATDRQMLKKNGEPYSRQRIKQLEQEALGKLGLSEGTVDSLISAQEQKDRALDMLQKGQRLTPGERKSLGIDPDLTLKKAARRMDRAARADAALEALRNRMIREIEKNGPLSPEREAFYVRESERLYREGQGVPETAAAEPAPGVPGAEQETPVRSAGAGAVQEPPPDVGPAPEAPVRPAEGNAPSGTAVAGGREAGGNELSPIQRAQLARTKNPWLREVLTRRFAGAETLTDTIEARGGIDPKSLGGDLGYWKETLGDWIFKDAEGKKGTWAADVAAQELVNNGKLPPVPETTNQIDHLMNSLVQHHLVDASKWLEADASPQGELGYWMEKTRAELHAQGLTDEAIERRIAETVSSGEAAGARERSDEPPAEVIRSEIGVDQGASGPEAAEESAADHAESANVLADEPRPGVDAGSFDPDELERPEPVPGTRPGFEPPVSEELRRGTTVGGGQENAPGGTPERTTALANEVTDRERAARGEEPILRQARQADPVLWDRAMQLIDADPKIGERLVDEILRKSRPVSDEENAILLQRRVSVANGYEKAVRDQIKAYQEGADAITLHAAEAKEVDFRHQMDDTDRAIVLAGSEWGRSGRWRQVLAREDYSLAGMLHKAAAAKGRDLTPEEKQQIIDLQKRISDLQGRLDAAEEKLRESGTGVNSPAYPEWTQAREAAEAAKGDFTRQQASDRQANQTIGRRMEDLLLKIRRMFVISSPKTMAKIIAASAERIIFSPLEEVAGAGLSRLPGLAKIAAMAPREGKGFSSSTEKAAMLEGLTTGMKDAWANVKTGHSELDTLYGKTGSPRSWLDFVGELHAAGKAPAVRAEFTRSFLQIIDQGIARREDVTSPAALIRIGTEAYKDSNRAKFQQDNRVVDAWKKAINTLKAKDASVGSRAIGTTAELLLPVVRIPTNLVAEAFQYAFGSVTGSVRAAAALRTGVEKLKPEQADLIMRSLKKGSLGLAALTLGFLAPNVVGGFYSGRRREGDVEAGAIGGVPSYLLHNPLLEVLQLGASVRRALNGVRRGEGDFPTAATAGILGLAEEVPFVRETTEVAKAFDPKSRGRFFGEMAKSLAVPQLFQWMAGATDLDQQGNQIRRQPTDLMQRIQSGIPGLRQNVPVQQPRRGMFR